MEVADQILNLNCNYEFPTLDNIDYHVLFKEHICYFYLNLIRKYSHRNVLELSKQLSEVLNILKTCIQTSQDEYLPYLLLFYRMLGQTRDILYGKGEHEISYMMLLEFYKIYPTLAIYALHRYVQPINELDIPYGSWRDIKHLCEYIREHSVKGEDHELIKVCVNLVNLQLYTDLETWNFSIHSRSPKHLSNIAKWIPRENKKFDWLFDKLAAQYSSYIFETLTKPDSIIKATTKANRIYRKKISLLNKALKTTQIKQCSQKIDEIDPNNVAWYTLMKQPQLMFGLNKTYETFSKKMRDHITYTYKTGEHYSNYYPVSFFVKRALCVIGSQSEEKKLEIDILNKLWVRFSRTISQNDFNNILPILDASFFMQAMDSEEYYSAIGFSLLIAERSKFGKRILAVDYQSTWINIDECKGFVSTIENIYQTMLSRTNTLFNVDNTIDLFIYSLLQSRSTRRFIENMAIVIFSNFNSNFSINILKESFIKFDLPFPNIILWNLAKYNLVEPFYNINDKVAIMSGMSNGCFYSFNNILHQLKSEKQNIFENISMVLNDRRYDVLESYLKKIITL